MRTVATCLFAVVVAIVVSGCTSPDTPQEPTAVAQGLSLALQNGDYDKLYDLFVPELKQQRTKEDFATYMKARGPTVGAILIFDKVVMQGNTEAYAYYTASAGIVEASLPPIKLVLTLEGWHIDASVSPYASASWFTEGCVRDDDCDPPNAACVEFACVECAVDAHCTDAARSHCSGATCRECSVDSHCPTQNPVCGADGVCRECTHDIHCPFQKPVCGANYVCREGCTRDEHCPPEVPVCGPSRSCIECAAHADCPSEKPFCRDKTCWTAMRCLSDSECAKSPQPFCLRGFCSDKQCVADIDCPFDAPGATPNTICANGTCSPVACEYDGYGTSQYDPTCPTAIPFCYKYAYVRQLGTLTSACVQCVEDWHCQTERTPGRPYCSASNYCVECEHDFQCTDHARPNCSIFDQCVECATNADCTDSRKPRCSLSTGTCSE